MVHADSTDRIQGHLTSEDAELWASKAPVRPLQWLLSDAEGSELRHVPGRVTLVPSDAPGTVIKRHAGEPWTDRLHARLFGGGAARAGEREYQNLVDLDAAGFRVPSALGWAGLGRRSAVLMERIPARANLRDHLATCSSTERRIWLRRLARQVAAFHSAGWYHRDLYLQHFLVPEDMRPGDFVWIDVGRARREQRPRARWWVKDIAQLLHSCPPEVPFDDRLAFLLRYLDLRNIKGEDARRRWANEVEDKRRRMAAHTPRHGEVDAPLRPAHLVVRVPNWVGDLVMATPVLVAAARDPRWPRVTFLVRRHLAPVLADGPWCDPTGEGGSVRIETVSSRAAESARLAALAPDAVLLLTHSLGSARAARRVGVPKIIGAALAARGPLLTHGLVPPTRGGRRAPIPTAHLLRDVAGLAGLEVEDLHPRLGVRDSVAAKARAGLLERGLGPNEDYVLCCPGAAFGAAKLWPPERFAAALDELSAQHGLRPIVTGGPAEATLVAQVARTCRSDALDLSGWNTGLDGLKALVRDAKLLLVGDSGPRWYAAAFDVPCVTIMGPNFPELTATSLEHCTVVRSAPLECQPCIQRTCPLGHHRCMQDIPVASVVEAAEGQLRLAPEPVA